MSGNVQADVHCADGTSYTLAIPIAANQSYSIPANSNAWVASTGTGQSSAPAAACGASPGDGTIQGVYFSSLGVSPGNAKPGGPGFTTTDTTDPLNVEFSCSAGDVTSGFSKQVNVNPAIER